MLAAGIVGFFMLRHGFGPAPLIMGLILGRIVEESFSQAMILYDNNFLALFERPIAVFFFALTALGLAAPMVAHFLARRDPTRLDGTE